jgi:hypothetical protein
VRGRLIFPFLAELAQLDTAATAADPDGAGPLAAGYDPIFRSPVVRTDGTGARVSSRAEVLVQLPTSIDDKAQEQLRMMATGNAPGRRLVLTFHFRDLERRGLVDTNGDAKIRVNDRLVRILTRDGQLVQLFGNPPGVFVTELNPLSYGLGRKRNLLDVTLEDREQTATTFPS